MKKLLSNPKGFTLVELMVVVAIIGILSAIAVPNFKKYQSKSKQSEAKIQLAAVYSTEVGASSDFDTYATCLTDLGYDVQPRGYYRVGFSAAAAAPNLAVRNRGAVCTDAGTFSTLPPLAVNQLRANAAVAFPAVADVVSAAPDSLGFTAGAAGNISVGGANTYDKWQITQTKALTNNLSGI